MNVLEQGDFKTSVPEKGKYFLNLIQDLKSKHKEVGDVDGLGLALRMEMCESDSFTASRRLADAMFQKGLDGNLSYAGQKMGLILDIGGYFKNVITLAPSLEISYREMDMAHDLLDQLITSFRAARHAHRSVSALAISDPAHGSRKKQGSLIGCIYYGTKNLACVSFSKRRFTRKNQALSSTRNPE